MAVAPVNLDALIKREDFLVDADQSAATPKGGNLKSSELEDSGIVFQMLRKPDFQRETASWTPQKVFELIRAFVDGELIPSIIMWRSPKSGNIFVIDGAHRLSAFIAWIHDDYGDRQISLPFFDNSIPQAQKGAAAEARRLIDNGIGPYSVVKARLHNKKGITAEQESRAKHWHFAHRTAMGNRRCREGRGVVFYDQYGGNSNRQDRTCDYQGEKEAQRHRGPCLNSCWYGPQILVGISGRH